jgi:3-methyladenine DNA glycosylase/8-oxoguanine DNA glycosylase
VRSGAGRRVVEEGRWGEALAFLGHFPAYGAQVDALGRVWVGYWDEQGLPQELGFELSSDGSTVSVLGDWARGRRVLGLDGDFRGAFERAQALEAADPIGALIHRWWPLRPVLFADLFEGFAWAILGQQISVALAGRMKTRIAHRYGLPWREGYRFPNPARLVEAEPEDLRSLGLSRPKVRALRELATAFASGWDPRPLATQPLEDARRALTARWGIGPWTAEYVLARVLGHPGALPAKDVALRRRLAELTQVSSEISEAHIRTYLAEWAPWHSLVAFYLWFDRWAARTKKLPLRGGGAVFL